MATAPGLKPSRRDLRHTTASVLAAQRASLLEIADVLGHRTMAMVKRYSHLAQSHKVSIIEKMAKEHVYEVFSSWRSVLRRTLLSDNPCAIFAVRMRFDMNVRSNARHDRSASSVPAAAQRGTGTNSLHDQLRSAFHRITVAIRTAALIMAVASCVLMNAVAGAAEPGPYQYKTASPDGIGKFYFNREIAQVMGYEGAAWLERPTREQEERPDLLVKELHLAPGMSIADIGAGSGYLSKRMATLVLPGKVLAVDVQPQMVAMLRDLSRQPGAGNIVPILGSADDPKLPANSIDLALMVDVYHELEFPYEMISHLLSALRPGGQLVLVEYRGEDASVPIKELHKMTLSQVRRELQQFPLTFVRSDERLPIQHIIFFRKH